MSRIILHRRIERVAQVLDVARRLSSSYLEAFGYVAAVGIPLSVDLFIYPLYAMKAGHSSIAW